MDLIIGPYTYRQLQDYYKLVFSMSPFEALLCADESDAFVLHIGSSDECGHAIGLKPDIDTNSFLVYDSHNEVVMRIEDELLYDIVLQFASAQPSRCRLLRVMAEDSDLIVEDSRCLELRMGAKCSKDKTVRKKATARCAKVAKKNVSKSDTKGVKGKSPSDGSGGNPEEVCNAWHGKFRAF